MTCTYHSSRDPAPLNAASHSPRGPALACCAHHCYFPFVNIRHASDAPYWRALSLGPCGLPVGLPQEFIYPVFSGLGSFSSHRSNDCMRGSLGSCWSNGSLGSHRSNNQNRETLTNNTPHTTKAKTQPPTPTELGGGEPEKVNDFG